MSCRHIVRGKRFYLKDIRDYCNKNALACKYIIALHSVEHLTVFIFLFRCENNC